MYPLKQRQQKNSTSFHLKICASKVIFVHVSTLTYGLLAVYPGFPKAVSHLSWCFQFRKYDVFEERWLLQESASPSAINTSSFSPSPFFYPFFFLPAVLANVFLFLPTSFCFSHFLLPLSVWHTFVSTDNSTFVVRLQVPL